MKKIIIVDDDQDVHTLIQHTLGKEFELTFCEYISDGESQIIKKDFDLIILDEVLPDGNGSELLTRLKQSSGKSNIPVIMLTQRKELKDKLNAFDAGADDYVSKPFEPLELMARVQARLRENDKNNPNTIEREDLVLELTSQTLSIKIDNKETDVGLTPIEFKILYHLAKEEGVVRSRAELLETVWGKNQNVIDRTVDQHVSKLRKKLEPSRLTVKSLHKKGYLLAEEA